MERLASRRVLLGWVAAAVPAVILTGVGIDALVEGSGPHIKDWPDAPSQPPVPHEAQLPHRGMEQSSDPALRRLAAYEQRLGHGFSVNMLRTEMPRTRDEAEAQAKLMATTLKEYKKQGIPPLVMLQPTANNGAEGIDLRTVNDAQHSDGYDGYKDRWDHYFATMVAEGVTSEDMGTWVPFPTPNIPAWQDGVTDADVFKNNFVPVAQALKTHFTEARVSVLLDTTTYPNNDWSHGSTDNGNMLEYVTGLPKGLVDSIGIQGLPYAPGDNPATYLRASAATAAATRVGVKDVWLNTGSFSQRQDVSAGLITCDPQTRVQHLVGEWQQAQAVKQAGFNVSINVFAQNNFSQGGPDWSYPIDSAPSMTMLKQGADAAAQAGIPISLYAPN